MKAFTYHSAASEESASSLLGEKALALAGGTSLLNLMKDYVLQPEAVVDIKRIPGTAAIEKVEGGLRIGANVTLSEIVKDATVERDYPALAQALRDAGTPQIRNMATLGGNLCARPTTCWYFAHEAFDCLKRGGSTCPAREGENELHAIFDNGASCVAVHPSSAAPALVVYGAKLRIAGAQGAREVGIEEFFVSPRTDPLRENVLKANEIVTHVILGAASPRSATYEVRQKAGDWPLAMASVALVLDGRTCRSARICLGAVAPTPRRAAEAEAALAGKAVTPESAQAAAGAAVHGATPLAHNAHKVKMTHTAVKRAILLAAG
jgi:xanthine dehydrogenase YagS FAD-binding subunit